MKRLWKYLEGRKLRVGADDPRRRGKRRCADGGWLLVRNAIDKGIVPPDNEHHLTIVVAIYLGVAAAGWLLQA